MSANDIPLYLFAKTPRPGEVKTRMQPQLSEQQSAQLARQMLEQSMARVERFWGGSKLLAATPDTTDPLLQSLCRKYHFEIVAQHGEDLGERLLAALSSPENKSESCVVLGCDVPYIPGKILLDTWQHVSNLETVIGPALDGGFYLLGTTISQPELFSDIQWGGSGVCDQLEANLRELSQSWHRLPVLRDIDTPDDLAWLVEHDVSYRDYFSSSGAATL